jgi:hypothetical protein
MRQGFVGPKMGGVGRDLVLERVLGLGSDVIMMFLAQVVDWLEFHDYSLSRPFG